MARGKAVASNAGAAQNWLDDASRPSHISQGAKGIGRQTTVSARGTRGVCLRRCIFAAVSSLRTGDVAPRARTAWDKCVARRRRRRASRGIAVRIAASRTGVWLISLRRDVFFFFFFFFFFFGAAGGVNDAGRKTVTTIGRGRGRRKQCAYQQMAK